MKVTAIIEKGTDGGFSIYTHEIAGVIGSGMTELEARDDFEEVLAEQIEYYKEIHNEVPEWENAEIEYRYDLSAFFMAYPFINVTQFAKTIGINPSLMRKYKQGIATASANQRAIIQDKLHALAMQLSVANI